MNTAPNENVKLTFDQLQAIDVAEKRLANIQNEVSVATQVLTQARLDAEKATKERLYQEDLLKELAPKVTTLQTQHVTLLAHIHNGTEHLSEVMARARQVDAESEKKLSEIHTERTKLDADVIAHNETVAAHAAESQTLTADREVVRAAKQVLADAIAQITL